MFKYLMAITCALGSLTIKAQESWSLEQCVEYAIENNLEIKQSELDLEVSKANVNQSKGQFLPSVNGSAFHQFNYGRTVDPFTNTFATDWVQSNNFDVSADLNLFTGLQTYNNYKQNEFNYKASEASLENTKYEMVLSLSQAYLQVLFNIENLRVANAQADITQDQVDRTAKLVAAGTAPKANLLDVEAQLAQEQLNIVDVENRLTISRLQLLQLLQLPGDTNINIVEPDSIKAEDIVLPPSINSTIEEAFASYPSLKRAEYSKLSAQSALAVSKGGYSPRLSLRGSVGTGYSELRLGEDGEIIPFGDQLDENLNRTIGFGLTVPIFNQFSTNMAVSRARIQYEKANTAILQEQQRIRQTIEQAYADAKAAGKRYQATEKSLKSLELSFQYSQKRFDVGTINAVDFNTSKTNLTRAQSDLVRAKYEYLFRYIILKVYQGEFMNDLIN
jgi:outer membrane protein